MDNWNNFWINFIPILKESNLFYPFIIVFYILGITEILELLHDIKYLNDNYDFDKKTKKPKKPNK